MNKTNYTCIFGGGAIRGVAYLGAYKAMLELGINPQTIAGASVGSIFAALVAVGSSLDELNEVFMNVNFDLFRDIHFGFGKDFAISKGDIFLDWVRKNIEKSFYGEDYKEGENPAVTFKDLDKNLVIVTTDFQNFDYKEFSKFATPDYEIAQAVRISCAMPGLMRPVPYNKITLIDGDLLKSSPMWKLSKYLCPENERVLEFRLEGEFEQKANNAINFANTLHSCISGIATKFVIKETGDNDKIDYIVINTGAMLIVDFNCPKEKRENLLQIGYEKTMDYFKNYLPQKKQKLIPKYDEIWQILNKIEHNISVNRISNAKNEIGTLFIKLSEYQNFLDYGLYNKIVEFKDSFFENLQVPSLFGKYKLKNFNVVSAQSLELKQKIKARLDELTNYSLS